MAWLKCAVCGFLQADALFREGAEARCPACQKRTQATLLPALYGGGSRPPPLQGEAAAPGEAVCFYDESLLAVKSCSHCGVFISEVWSAAWGGETVCLRCLESLRAKGADIRFQAGRKLWDNIALGVAIGPVLLAVALTLTLVGYVFGAMCLLLTLVSAPAAVFLALRFWNAPRSLVPRGRGRLVAALGLALLQMAAWVVGIVGLVYLWRNGWEGFE